MRERVPVFVSFLRLMQSNEDAFLWACDHLGIEVEDEDHCEELEDILEADLIRFGEKYAIREDNGNFVVWDPETDEWTAEDDELMEITRRHPINPLREHQDGYLEMVRIRDAEPETAEDLC